MGPSGNIHAVLYHAVLNFNRKFIKLPYITLSKFGDRFYGLVFRVPGCRPRGPGFDSRALPHFLSSSESGTWSIQPRKDK
jgi:hypothetical protein